jgi:hypothetical protein
MNQRNPVIVILSLLAFIAFGAISCWATSESLFHTELFGQGVPKIMYWIIVVGFYVITSLGTKWIIDSFNTEAFVENRMLKLIGGLLIVAVFWIIVSLPTNAHTFLYKRSAKSVAQKELKWQEGQLSARTDIDAYELQIRNDIMKPVTGIIQLKESLVGDEGEINHPERPGYAKESEEILQKIESKLGVKIGTIKRIQANNSSKNEINRLRGYYSNAIDDQLTIYVADLEKQIAYLVANYEKHVADAKSAEKLVRAAYEALNADDESREDVLKEARKQINNAYNVLDNGKIDGATSTRENYVENVKGMPSNRLTNVVEVVYKDYLSGQLNKKYDMPETKGMIYFFLLSLMIDLAAFLFFNIAFKKN